MLLSIDLICKSCGKEMNISVLMDENGVVNHLQNVCSCGHQINSQDEERLYHLVDTFATFNLRNEFGKIIQLSLFPHR